MFVWMFVWKVISTQERKALKNYKENFHIRIPRGLNIQTDQNTITENRMNVRHLK